MKKIIRLTEGDLHKIVKNSVKKILMEQGNDVDWLDDPRNSWTQNDDWTQYPDGDKNTIFDPWHTIDTPILINQNPLIDKEDDFE